MGVGKTAIGKRLANALTLTFCDLDTRITANESLEISQIFDSVGEVGFRDIEAKALRSLSTMVSPYWTAKEKVVATGGGTPCFHENMDFMRDNGIVIWLKIDPEIIASRLKSARQKRPLIAKLNDDQILDFVNEKLKLRESFYEKAHIHFDATNFSSPRLQELVKTVKNYSK